MDVATSRKLRRLRWHGAAPYRAASDLQPDSGLEDDRHGEQHHLNTNEVQTTAALVAEQCTTASLARSGQARLVRL
jgi:hypothetical protein